ncbi:right-handed parallel beta-helix repeat-containing protein [uncultured Thiohalocapsa sp.]|uniref:right-handed parallel beta-helix repeat-containing protein n=1 Tax=uncultured Thiohalocapsa sp. TaxID=768990 RepID=UPI0025E640A3|nr:right-handed parallel beta-helix repeat-containing protein [uncultured Thiohalocapsa sp.]
MSADQRSAWVSRASLVVLLFALLLVVHAAPAGARVLRVGPESELKVPSAAARVAKDGDTVEIAAGDYRGDVASWRQNRLTLRGVGGRPHLRAAGRAAEGKAIWVIKGNDVLVENIEMSGTRVPGFAGAGIRAEGGKLTLRNVHFHHHQMGILTNHNPRGELAIIDSEFNHNIVDYERHGRLGHNIYVGRIASFELRGSHVHGAVTGHQVKTRARKNTIVGNRIVDGDGGASYLIDLAEGGESIVRDNLLRKSERADNNAAISYMPEGDRSRRGTLFVGGNLFESEGSAPVVFVRNLAENVEAVLSNNVLRGNVTPLEGRGRVR